MQSIPQEGDVYKDIDVQREPFCFEKKNKMQTNDHITQNNMTYCGDGNNDYGIIIIKVYFYKNCNFST